jgi:hypothetical protein
MENENNNGSKPATDAQMQLIKQLCDELAYKPETASDMLVATTVEDASQKIHYLKECKLRDAQLRLQNAKVNGFDKITFAMLSKLVWSEEDKKYFAHRARECGLEGAFCELYDTYKRVDAAVKAHVAEGGQQ